MKAIISILLILISTFLYSQKGIQLKNIDVGFGGFSVLLKNYSTEKESGGLVFNLNTEFVLKNHLLSLNFIKGGGGGGGSGYASIGGDFNFYKIDFLYGRQFNILKWLALDANVGLGYYHQNSNLYFTNDEINKSTLNFPIKGSLIFLPHNKLSFGLNSNYDINKLNNTFSENLFLRYNFVK